MERIDLSFSDARRQLASKRNSGRVIVTGVFEHPPEQEVVDIDVTGIYLRGGCMVVGLLQPYNLSGTLAGLNDTLRELLHPVDETSQKLPRSQTTPFRWAPRGLNVGRVGCTERVGTSAIQFSFDDPRRGSKLTEPRAKLSTCFESALYATTDVLFYPDPRLAWLAAGYLESLRQDPKTKTPALEDLLEFIPRSYFDNQYSSCNTLLGGLEEIYKTIALGPSDPCLSVLK